MGASATLRYAGAPLWPRVLNVLLGAWLFASAFLRPPGDAQFVVWTTGLLVATTALTAIWAPAVRFATTFLGAFLGLMALVLDYGSRITRLHDLAMAGLVILLSLVPSAAPELAEA